jgi:hypothetical protein
MPKVLTEASLVNCAHVGQVLATAGQSKLKVAGSRVLVLGDLVGKPIAGCTTPPVPVAGTLPCLATVTAGPSGVAPKLRVAGRPVLLESISGQTSGTIGGAPQTWSVTSANQTRLKVG